MSSSEAMRYQHGVPAGISDLPENWWSIPGENLLKILGVSPENGLGPDQVHIMQGRYGMNSSPGQEASSFWELFWQSIRSPMMILLLAIAGISLTLGQFREAIVMVFVVATYVIIELINKSRSDNIMAQLRKLQSPTSTILRDGRQQEVSINEISVGDILYVQTGTKITADARLLSSIGLLVNEGSLTGESAPQLKDADAYVPADAPLAERMTALFSGTTVLDGQGIGIVLAVGENSELGRVATLASGVVSTPTPLQKAVLLTIFVIPLLAGMPFPFAPIQIIATELLMDLASSTIFVSEVAEPDVMQRKPQYRVKFLSGETGRLILRNMLGLTIAILVAYFCSFSFGYDETSARTAAFATWLLGHVLLALTVKQTQIPLFKQGILANRFGAGWLVGMIALVLIMTMLPDIHPILSTTFLEPVQWVLVIGGAILASGWIEALKLIKYHAPV